jgi:hypothetical protein
VDTATKMLLHQLPKFEASMCMVPDESSGQFYRDPGFSATRKTSIEALARQLWSALILSKPN